MTATGHAVIGTVIAAKIANPYLAIPLALASHLAADIFPHWDSGTHMKTKSKIRMFFEATMDVLIGFSVSYAILFFFFPKTNLSYAFLMIITAQLFDWLTVPYTIFGINFAPSKWLYKFQAGLNGKLDKPWGIINQVGILVLIVVLAKLL